MSLRAQALTLLAIVVALVVIVIGAVRVTSWVGAARVRAAAEASFANVDRTRFVGREACASCHESEHDAWIGSHHDLAMDGATDATVLGDFDDATFEHHGVMTRFRRDGDAFIVSTAGEGGVVRDFEVAYTFGVDPLQQYLVAFPDGGHQTLPFAWDTRPADAGGQRWFHVYGEEPISSSDSLFWTTLSQNWDHMCAECHSTNLVKRYDTERGRFTTTWSEIDVSCESCHGPGARHVAWADANLEGIALPSDPAGWFPVSLANPNVDAWDIDPETGSAVRRSPPPASAVIDACARCHARRGALRETYEYGRPLLDTHRPATIAEPLYFVDGQIRDEVYVYGSFLQSRMHAKGVTCLDCHDAHTADVLLPGNTLCATCHDPERFDVPAHHFHEVGTEGASCVACHMPSKNYMVVDPRHDHSLRIPRPDLTIELGVPNACNQCHVDETPEWAMDAVGEWYGPETSESPHYGQAFHAARVGAPDAEAKLLALIVDEETPAIVRATAVERLGDVPSGRSMPVQLAALDDPDPLVRLQATRGMSMVDPAARVRALAPRLDDDVLAVRIEAAMVLADVPVDLLTPATRASLEAAQAEYVTAQLANAERASAHTNIALLYVQQGRLAEAERALNTAVRLEPDWTPAYVNYADLLRMTERDDEGERLLRGALDRVDQQAPIHHALGLLEARQGRMSERADGLRHLEAAAAMAPENPRYAYVYGVALHSLGQRDAALDVLQRSHVRHPADIETLFALATMQRDAGRVEDALQYAQQMLMLRPGDPAIQGLYQELVRQLP